jgi:hypothetical protein
MAIKTLEDAETYVEGWKNVHWDGFGMFRFRPNPRAIMSPDGVMVDGEWGYRENIPLTREGYEV